MQNLSKTSKLLLSLLFDTMGMATYFFPFLGEAYDIIWAPISGFLLYKMYPGETGKIAGTIGFLEEIIPFTDAIPTFTLTWIYTHVIHKKP